MMLASARRSAGSDLGHMDLVDGVELGCADPGQQAGEPGHVAGAHHQSGAVPSRLLAGGEQGSGLGYLVGGGDDGRAGLHRGEGQDGLRSGGGRHHHQVGSLSNDRPLTDPGLRAEPAGDGAQPFQVGVAHLHRADAGTVVEHAHDPQAGGTGTEDDRGGSGGLGGHASSSSRSSRHPPVCGGTPPRPRTRMAAASAMPTTMATNVRRIKVMNPAAKTASGRCRNCDAAWLGG